MIVMDLHIEPVESLQGELIVPGDKSISHRAVMLGALASGITEIDNFLMGADNLSTISCFCSLGITCEILDSSTIVVHGRGLDGLQEPDRILDVGNSGTTMRLLLGILSGQQFFSCLTGDDSICKRPMKRVTDPLLKMGANILGRVDARFAPLAIQGKPLCGINYQSPVASAQVKSALLLAGLFAEGDTSVVEPNKSRDHSERMFRFFGADIRTKGLMTVVKSRPNLIGQNVHVPGDISSAAYFLVAGAIIPNSRITLKDVGINPTRDGIIKVLKDMGANLEILNSRTVCGEPVADLVISTSNLKGSTIQGEIIPSLIDEIPIIAVAAAMAEGKTVIKDASELKVKETDRIATLTAELSKLGVDIKATDDGMIIQGGKPLKGGVCESHGDHRIAMSVAVAGMVAKGKTVIRDSNCIDVSFPNFSQMVENLK